MKSSNNSITPVKLLVEEAKKKIEIISSINANKKVENKDYVFVDIRDIRELWRDGKIKNSYHAPRGMLEFWVDPSSPYYKKIFSNDKKFILYCASGWRSSLATLTLKNMGMKNIMSLEGGYINWKKNNFPVDVVK